jgi:ABC-type nitrate/sulfonate/bicarbonate transport system substrate-binding protein
MVLKKKFRSLALLPIVAMVAVACGGTEPTAEPTEEETTATEASPGEASETADPTACDEYDPVTYMGGVSGGAIFIQHVAQKYELDKPHCVELELLAGDIAQVPFLIASREADLGFLGPVNAIRSNQEGAPTVIFTNGYLGNAALIVPADDPAESLEDLVGRTLVTQAPSTSVYQLSALIAAQLGLSLEDDFDLVTGPYDVIAAEAAKGNPVIVSHTIADAIFASGDFKYIWVNQSDIWEELVGRKYISSGAGASLAWFEEDLDRACRVARVFEDTAEFIVNNPEQVVRENITELGLQDADEATIDSVVETWWTAYDLEWGPDTWEQVYEDLKLFEEAGFLEDLPEPDLIQDIVRYVPGPCEKGASAG